MRGKYRVVKLNEPVCTYVGLLANEGKIFDVREAVTRSAMKTTEAIGLLLSQGARANEVDLSRYSEKDAFFRMDAMETLLLGIESSRYVEKLTMRNQGMEIFLYTNFGFVSNAFFLPSLQLWSREVCLNEYFLVFS